MWAINREGILVLDRSIVIFQARTERRAGLKGDAGECSHRIVERPPQQERVIDDRGGLRLLGTSTPIRFPGPPALNRKGRGERGRLNCVPQDRITRKTPAAAGGSKIDVRLRRYPGTIPSNFRSGKNRTIVPGDKQSPPPRTVVRFGVRA